MTAHDDERLGRAYRELLARRVASGAALPATLEEIAELARTGAHTPSRAALLDRVLADPRTRDEFLMLRELADGRAPSAASRRAAWPLAAAAALVLVAGAALLARAARPRAADPVRGETAALTLVAPRAGEALGVEATFVWQGVPGAASYVLEVLSEGGDVVTSVETADTATVTAVPDAARGRAGARWWVVARLADGGTLRSELRPLAGGD